MCFYFGFGHPRSISDQIEIVNRNFIHWSISYLSVFNRFWIKSDFLFFFVCFFFFKWKITFIDDLKWILIRAEINHLHIPPASTKNGPFNLKHELLLKFIFLNSRNVSLNTNFNESMRKNLSKKIGLHGGYFIMMVMKYPSCWYGSYKSIRFSYFL